jgi:hypothetical protein
MAGQDIVKVRRITVDSRFTDSMVRLEICPLITRLKYFTDKQEDWGYEKSYILMRENFKDILQRWGLPKAKIKKLSWHDFKEGRVFLLGTFRIKEIKIKVRNKENKNHPKTKIIKRFVVDTKEYNFERIDEWVHEIMRKLYFSTLSRRHVRGSRVGRGR